VEPSGKFTTTEREEFIRATQMLATRYEQHQRDSLDVKIPGRRKPYKTWSEHEMYTLSVSWLLLRASVSDMAEAFEGRTVSQVRTAMSFPTTFGAALKWCNAATDSGICCRITFSPSVFFKRLYFDPCALCRYDL
jgi:hypothetical protein